MADPSLQEQARALGDPTRHRIFRLVADASRPVDVAELTTELGLNHNAVRQHLAKLAAAGLVAEQTAAPTGPGRPRLEYVVDPACESRWGVVGPFERLAHWLVELVESGESPEQVGERISRRRPPRPEDSEDPVEALVHQMRVDGFDPAVRTRGSSVEIELRSCPFESVAVASPATVCGLHLGLARGLAARAGGLEVDALVANDPRRASCRLRCHRTLVG